MSVEFKCTRLGRIITVSPELGETEMGSIKWAGFTLGDREDILKYANRYVQHIVAEVRVLQGELDREVRKLNDEAASKMEKQARNDSRF